MSLEKTAKMPQLYDANGDLSKQWNVYYSYKDPTTGKMKRFQVTEGINKLMSKDARYAHGRKLITKYRRKLKRGYNPFDDGQYLYKDTVTHVENKRKGYKVEERPFDFSIEHYVSNALAEYGQHLRKGSFNTYKTKVRCFVEWLKGSEYYELDIKDFTSVHAQEFLNSLGKHSNTISNQRTIIKTVFNWVMSEGVIQVNPFVGTRIPKPYTTEAYRAFRRYEIEMIKGYCQEHGLTEQWLVIEFIFYCFIRPGELRQLKVSDIDTDKDRILIRSSISKNKQSQYVTIPETFKSALVGHIKKRSPKDYVFGKNGRKRGDGYFTKKHRLILDALGFGLDVSLYSWKHTGAVFFYEGTKDIKALQRQLRHASLDQVNEYLHSLGCIENESAKNHFPKI